MRTDLLIMGCAQTSASIPPPNDIPIEPLYTNEDYQSMHAPPPVVMITASPTPAYVKSVLKKTHPHGRGKTERLSFLIRKQPSINKSVNFNEQVLVKARTPTPNKIWYEKASSTMPMRRYPPNDDDDEDYEGEEEKSVSSDEEQENNEQMDTEPALSPGNLLLQRNQTNNFWYKPNTIGPAPTTNTMSDDPIAAPVNRIKVRRKLPQLGPPLIIPSSSYQPPLKSSTAPLYQLFTRASTVPTYRLPSQTSFVSPYQSTIRSSTLPPYSSSNPPLIMPSPVQPVCQAFPVRQTLLNPNAVPIEHRPTLTNGQSFPQTASYTLNRHPIGNVT